MRLVGLVIWISLAATSLVGQEVSGAVIKGNCPKDLPEYKQWLERTPSADGGQYVADSARKHKTISRYSKLRLNMSADEIEGLLGKPDFAVSQHLAEPALSDRPATATCPARWLTFCGRSAKTLSTGRKWPSMCSLRRTASCHGRCPKTFRA